MGLALGITLIAALPVTLPTAAGDSPVAAAANPITKKIYVANRISDSVTTIDGDDNSPSTMPAGYNPNAIVVIVVTNKS